MLKALTSPRGMVTAPHHLAGRTERNIAMRAKSADASLLRTLDASSLRGRVHSVFERVVNVEVEGGELVTLASRDLDNAPNTVVVDTPRFGMIGISVNDSAVAVDGKLRVGKSVVLLEGAAPWEGTLPAYPRADLTLRANLRIVESRLDRRQEVDGVIAHRPQEGAFFHEAATALAHRATLLSYALSRADLESACTRAKGMIGLGRGLTPSGDDFLVGLFAVLNIAGSPCYALRNVCLDIIADAEHATNAISLAALTKAARGRVRESIVTLTTQLIHGTRESLIPSLTRVFAIGSSSGTDIVAGIVSGFELNLQVGGSQPCQ